MYRILFFTYCTFICIVTIVSYRILIRDKRLIIKINVVVTVSTVIRKNSYHFPFSRYVSLDHNAISLASFHREFNGVVIIYTVKCR